MFNGTMKLSALFSHRFEFYFLSMVALYVGVCWFIADHFGYASYFKPLIQLFTGAQISLTFFLGYLLYRLIRAIILLAVNRPRKPALFLWHDLRQGPLNPTIYLRALPVFIGFLFFFSAFTSMKPLIGKIQPFPWDIYFLQLDNYLHFGIDPWRIFQPIIGYPWITKLISLVYISWIAVFFLVLYWQLFRVKDELLRARFFYSFVLCWAINGTFVALYFSSAGPCFLEEFNGNTYFQPLMDYLYGVNESLKIYALNTQEIVWGNFIADNNDLTGGISAFPSIHVATAFLFVLLGYRINRICFTAFALFFTCILVGSIHLGWHYAVDGYFSIFTTAVIWWASGRLANKSYQIRATH